MSKKLKDVDAVSVIELLKANPEKRFRLKYITKLFGVSEASIKALASENPNTIKQEKTLDGRFNYYYLDDAGQRKERWVKPFTPMTPELYAKRIDTKGVVSI
jgi:hypothetical protein